MKRILVVEDDDALGRALRATLETAGFEVLAASGEEALAVLDRCHIDLVLTERRLKGTDGLALLWCVKAEHPGVPVVLMTAEEALAPVVEAMRLGAEDYLVRPFPAQRLLGSVGRAIARRACTGQTVRLQAP
jgi:two-component system C4-dicarboxylate transport response regulator DctD